MNKPLMRHLGIDEAWLNLGLVTVEQLRDFDQLERADEYRQHTEHFRYWRYCEFLKRTTTFDDQTFNALLGILWQDFDRIMATAVLKDLGRHEGVSNAQFEILRAIAPPPARRSIETAFVLRRIRAEGMTVELIKLMIESRNAILQQTALAEAKLSTDQLQHLMENGENKAIRNVAKQLLQSN